MRRTKEQFPTTALAAFAITLAAALLGGCGSSGGGTSTTATATDLAPVHGAYSPSIDPADFVSTIDNRYFPLKPGTTFLYKGVHENGKTPQTDKEIVTSKTKQILGVRCVVVRDIVSSYGKPIEKTFDWYALDMDGIVWYMGEDTRVVGHGRFVKMSDSWEGGVNGAQPGIIMPGNPQPGEEYRQEYYPGHALDQARVLGSGGPVKVTYGSYKHTLLTVETSPRIDPGVAERKYYVAGLGDVKEQTVSGNREQIELVSVSR
jgi:hypothetical protein